MVSILIDFVRGMDFELVWDDFGRLWSIHVFLIDFDWFRRAPRVILVFSSASKRRMDDPESRPQPISRDNFI